MPKRVTEYNLKEMWKSPNGTIRAILDGTVFRSILVKRIEPFISNWKKPITIARHAYGDVYRNVEMTVPAGAKAELIVTKADGTEERALIHDFKTAGIIQGQHNIDKSIESFAKSCFQFCAWYKTGFMVLHKRYYFKKKYDHRFKDIFNDLTKRSTRINLKGWYLFLHAGLDDAVARVIRSEGGYSRFSCFVLPSDRKNIVMSLEVISESLDFIFWDEWLLIAELL